MSPSVISAAIIRPSGSRAEYHQPNSQVSTRVRVSAGSAGHLDGGSYRDHSVQHHAPRSRAARCHPAIPVASIIKRLRRRTLSPLCPIATSQVPPFRSKVATARRDMATPRPLASRASMRSKRLRSKCHPAPNGVRCDPDRQARRYPGGRRTEGTKAARRSRKWSETPKVLQQPADSRRQSLRFVELRRSPFRPPPPKGRIAAQGEGRRQSGRSASKHHHVEGKHGVLYLLPSAVPCARYTVFRSVSTKYG